MTEINDLNTSAASNNLPAPDGYPENTMIINDLNDAGREDLARLARWYGDHKGSTVTTGTLTAYVFASNRTLAAYYDGLDIVADFHVACGASPTFNVDGVAAAPLIWPDGTALVANDIPINAKVMLRYDGVSFQVMSAVFDPGSKQNSVVTTRGDIVRGGIGGVVERLAVGGAATVLTSDGTDPSWQALNAFASGTRMLFQQTAAPTGWTKEVGATFDNIGLRVVTGTIGGSTVGTDTWTTTFSPSKTTGGHSLTIAQLAAHTHPQQSDTHVDAGGASPGDGAASSATHGGTTQSTGSGTAHTHPMTMDLQYRDVIVAAKD